MDLPRRLLLLIAAALMMVAMTVVTAGPALASDLTKDPAKEKKDEGSGADKAKKAAKDLLK